MQYLTVGRNHPARRPIEDHIRDIYRATYNAVIADFPALLAAGLDMNNRPVCAAGLHFSPVRFFSESYLDEPIEAAILRHDNRAVARDDLVEITTLVSSQPGAAMRLFDFIATSSHAAGRSWAVFTASRSLRRCLGRRGAPLIEICPAAPDRLANAAAWGSYYETDPKVCALHNSPCAPIRFARPYRATGRCSEIPQLHITSDA